MRLGGFFLLLIHIQCLANGKIFFVMHPGLANTLPCPQITAASASSSSQAPPALRQNTPSPDHSFHPLPCAGLIPADTDYRLFSYRRAGSLPGIDVAQVFDGLAYHTNQDVADRVRPGTLQVRWEGALCGRCDRMGWGLDGRRKNQDTQSFPSTPRCSIHTHAVHGGKHAGRDIGVCEGAGVRAAPAGVSTWRRLRCL